MIRSAAEVRELGTILGIWAHPDDEAYLSGGLMTIARDLGSRVVCVTATHGELGTPDPVAWPPQRLAAKRTVEMADCMGILGVVEHHWLEYRDGECATAPAPEAIGVLCGIIEQVDPDTVLTFGPDGFTGHPDHQAVAAWAAAAFDRVARPSARLLQAAVSQPREQRWGEVNARLGVYLEGYPVILPDDRLVVDLALDSAIVERKVRALAAQDTQTSALIASLGLDVYTQWVGEEAFVERPRP